MTRDVSLVFPRMSFVGACLVVSLHMHDESLSGCLGAYFQKVIAALYRAAVPGFFMMSGYWLAGHTHERDWWKRAAVKRFQTLSIQFFFFAVLTLIIVFLLPNIAKCVGMSVDVSHRFDYLIQSVGLDLRYGVADNIWYLRCLFVVVLLSGMFVALANRSKLMAIIVPVIALLLPCTGLFVAERNFWYFGFNSVVFFGGAIGTLLRMCKLDDLLLRMTKWAAFALLIGVGGQRACFHSFTFDFVYLTFVVMGLLGVSYWLPIPSEFNRLSFPIYAWHGLVWLVLSWVLKMLHIYAAMRHMLVFVCVWFVVFFISVGIFWLLRRKTPRLSRAIYGGRG